MALRFPTAAAGASLLALLLAAAPALPQEGPPKVPAKEFFRGKVNSLEGRRISLSYDFSEAAQSEDWRSTYPFVRPSVNGGWRVEGGALRGDGNAGYRHRAVFDGEVKVEATLSSEDAKNFGVMILDEDRSVFNLCSLADTAFAMLDRKPPLMHQLTTFLPAGEGPGGSTEWRYIETSYEPRIGIKPVEVLVRKKGAMNEFRFGGTGRLAGADKEAKVGPRLAPGFYTLGSRVVVTKVTVSGLLDAKWLRENGVAFEDRSPADPDPPIAGKEPDPAAPGAGPGPGPGAPPGPGPGAGAPPPAGGGDWITHLSVLSDASKPKEAREKAADDLVATKERKALRPLIDVLYRDDDEAGRAAAWKAFKGLSGKNVPFRADAPKEARLKAMPLFWDVWYAAKEQMEKDERKKEK